MRDPGFGDHLVRHCAIAEPDMQMSRLETHSTAIRAIKPSSLGRINQPGVFAWVRRVSYFRT
jgi:hypothetical protein